ncbi:helix-turn-helix domain-containing protein [Kitasatospora sp. NBC_00458]|uniref:helix-turn-helix domain-containing protein n=1 Tax=Kitasatospora sp. NBC_00458 TaxID=2903568 RepID=UPI002E17201B
MSPVANGDDFHPGEQVLSDNARKLYLAAVHSGGRLTADAQEDAKSEVRELLELGLLVQDLDDHQSLVVADPNRLSTALSATWQRKALQLLSRSAHLVSELQDLGDAYNEHTRKPETGGPIEYISGKVLINQRLGALVERCSTELLTAQPGGGRRPETVRTAMERDLGVLQRGGTIRTIYQPSARYSSPTLEYVETMTHEGSHVRTLDEPFSVMIVIDRKVAIIPASEDMTMAAFIRDTAVVTYLVQTFDALWERAIPFPGSREVPPQVLSSLRRQVVRLMLQGIGHRVIARNLGLSERTLARHIAEMREDHGVDTLFQLGWKLAQQEGGAGSIT